MVRVLAKGLRQPSRAVGGDSVNEMNSFSGHKYELVHDLLISSITKVRLSAA